jgi:PIN domain nuclease of toxin-antitoxin system
MHLLLDTHALLWWFEGTRKLPNQVSLMISDPRNVILVSAASAWEIATKFRLGKLPSVAPIVSDLESQSRAEGFEPLAVTVRHAQRAGGLPGPHRDPFDRMLIAQALEEGCTLVSNEAAFDGYGIARSW